MISENPTEKKGLANVPDVDENGDPIYKTDEQEKTDSPDSVPDPEGTAETAEKSEFRDTPQDLKDETSQD